MFLYSPSAWGFGLSRKDARNLVRSLKLQLFCTLVGLGVSAVTSGPGEVFSGGAKYCLLRVLCFAAPPPRMRSFNPVLLLGKTGAENTVHETEEVENCQQSREGEGRCEKLEWFKRVKEASEQGERETS